MLPGCQRFWSSNSPLSVSCSRFLRPQSQSALEGTVCGRTTVVCFPACARPATHKHCRVWGPKRAGAGHCESGKLADFHWPHGRHLRVCVMNPPSVTSVVQSSYTFSINQRCVSESCQVFQIVRRHTINSTAHPRGEAKLRMQRRLFPKRGCPFNPSLHTGCCTDVTTVVKSLQPIKYTGCCDSCCTDVTTARDA